MASILTGLRAARPAVMRLAPRAAARSPFVAARSFSISRMSLERKYSDSHEWIDLSADRKHGFIGITGFAAHELGDVVYVELPEEGAQVVAGESLGAIESVKSASDICAPIGCTVVATNKALEEEPKIVNRLPEDDSAGGGWIVKVEVDEQGRKDFEELMTLEEYKKLTETEE